MEKEMLSVLQDRSNRLAKLRLKAILENVPVASACVATVARAVGLEEQILYQIQLAVDEACANVVEHAYAGLDPGDMEIVCYLGNRTFVIQVRDWGRGFDPDTIADPDVDAPLEERSLGGLGLFLVRQVMDWVRFRFDPDLGNEMVMLKRLPGAG